MAIELATGYVTLTPSARGFEAALRRQVTGVGTTAGGQVGGELGASMSSKFGVALKGMAGALAGAFAVNKIIDFGAQLLNTNAQLTAIDTKVRTVFESQSNAIRKWADRNNESFGLTDDALAGLAGNFGDLLKPMGFTSREAAAMSKKVVGLAGALSAWTGGQRSASDVAESLSKAMLGEREELKGLGISITEAEVSTRLFVKGQKELTGAALAQAKAIATQELIFEKSLDAQKAWAAGGNKALETSNRFKAGLAELQEQLGAKLGPVIVQIGNQILDWGAKLQAWVTENKPQIMSVIGDIGTAFSKIWTVIEPILVNLWERIKSTYKVVKDVVDLITAIVDGDWSEAWKQFKELVGSALDWVWGQFIALPAKLVGALANFAGDLAEEFYNAAKNAVSSFLSGLSGLVGLGGGSFAEDLKKIQSGKNPFRAAGGPVDAGGLYIVGEEGPEWFTPGASGFITPMASTSGGGAGLHIDTAYFGDRDVLPDLDYWARSRVAGV